MRSALLLAALVAGCATTAGGGGSAGNETFDGLVPIENARFDRAWKDPEIDLARYRKIIPGEIEFEFRAARPSNSMTARRSNQQNFMISERDRARLVEEVTRIFGEELQKSQRFEITDQPGPDTLIVRGALLDIVSFVPPDLVGRGEIYLDRVGQATLVLELVDSMSGEVVARAAERRSAEPPGRGGLRSSPVTTWAEVRRLARRWAVKLREGLDVFPEAG